MTFLCLYHYCCRHRDRHNVNIISRHSVIIYSVLKNKLCKVRPYLFLCYLATSISFVHPVHPTFFPFASTLNLPPSFLYIFPLSFFCAIFCHLFKKKKTRRTCFLFLLENTETQNKKNQLVYLNHQNVNSLCSRHHYVNSSC